MQTLDKLDLFKHLDDYLDWPNFEAWGILPTIHAYYKQKTNKTQLTAQELEYLEKLREEYIQLDDYEYSENQNQYLDSIEDYDDIEKVIFGYMTYF